MFMKLANNTSYMFNYSERDRPDIIQGSLYDLCRYWKSYKIGVNKDESSACFGYYTSTCRNAAKKTWMTLHKEYKYGIEFYFDDPEMVYRNL